MPLPPATHFRPRPLRAAQSVLPGMWRWRLLPNPDLAEVALAAAATAATGLDDFGDDGFARRQLRVLLAAIHDEADLNPLGLMIAHGSIVKALKERLWAQELFKRHPEILERPVVAPVVVLGHMRSGTTRLQRLLASDPQFVSLQMYEAMSPVPSPRHRRRLSRQRSDPRIGNARRVLGFLNWVNPALNEIHPTGALEVDEELGLLEASFAGAQIEAQWRVPSFARYCEAVDQTPAYAHVRRLLQLTGWLRGDPPERPWLLKTPQHLQDLPALMRVFPDARLIFTHRDPAVVVASGASLAWNFMVVQSDAVDPHWVGREWLHKTAHRSTVAEAARPAIAAAQQHDVRFDAVGRDWRAVMAEVYGFLGLELTPSVQIAMAHYLDRAAIQHRHHRHRYRAEDFGLAPQAVAERFAGYRQRYDVAAET